MSLPSTRSKLQKETRELLARWDRTIEEWNDPVSRRLQVEYLDQLERAVTRASEAMDAMNEVICRAQRECE
ncbi:MAG: hypothetical protein CMJ41_02845 [Phycisphaerae bacterium]|nr:hypothetical protein [Phycisphaerae bacterium]|tara:strand:- start:302 stop:514 length:213 start_codon:yes stop_codon:yes gene_type:complete